MKDVTGHRSGVMTGAISTLLIVLLPLFLLLSCTGVDTKNASNSSASAAVRVPAQPGDFTARPSDGKVTLAWAPPALATSYNLYWSTTSSVTRASNRILNVSMPYTHLDLMNGTTYFYKVSALNVSGEGDLSAEVRATPMPPFTKILTKLTDPDAEVNDRFGKAVAIDGDYAIVGAETSDQGYGAAYVFRRNSDGTWDPAGTRLTSATSGLPDTPRFGYAVGISGDYVIVGAPGEHTGEGGAYQNAGAVYIFHRSVENTWDAGVRLVINESYGRLGCAVAISGDYAIVGENGENRAWLFRRTGTNAWSLDGQLAILGMEPSDGFGAAVAMKGDYAIVGAPGEDGTANASPDSGAAYIFQRTGGMWTLASKIMPHDGAAGDAFGTAVAMSENYAAVSAAGKSSSTGAVYIFHRLDGTFWDEGPKIMAPDADVYDSFGFSIGITDRYVLVGAFGEDCGWDENEGEGAAYIYTRISTNTWDGGTKITIPQGDVADGFGYAVAISGEHAIIGAVGDDAHEMNQLLNTGAVYLY